jgi:chemotaxis protein MotB
VVIEDKGVALSIAAPVLFKLGSADVETESYPLLEQVFAIARGWPNVIRVEGHTDNTRISGGEYATNWDLAFARALNVVQFAIDYSKIHPSRLAPVSYGEYRPVASNDTPEGQAENRRIEIFMEYKKETEDPFK